MKSYFPFMLRCPFFLAIFLTLLLPSFAHAAILTVALDGSAQYQTIQAAINAASNGDTVLAADGIYTGDGNRDIDFYGKNITVKSQNGATSTIIDCQGNSSNPHRGFFFHSGETAAAQVDGFTVENGYGPNGISHAAYGVFQGCIGGGMLAADNSYPTIADCIFKGNFAGLGGGLVVSSDSVVKNCSFFNNYGTEGGGILIAGDHPSVINCTFSQNTGSIGGGAYIQGSSATIQNCRITSNTVSSVGGGLYDYIGGGAVTLTSCVITGNTASSAGGGIFNIYDSNGTTTLADCNISNNIAQTMGGGIFNEYHVGNFCSLTNCTITGNIAQGSDGNENGGGGGIYNDSGGYTTVSNCTITGNTASPNFGGGGIYNRLVASTLTNDIIYGDIGGEIRNDGGTFDTVSFSDIQGGSPGTNNIDADPQFVNAAYGNLHLKYGSPCIKAGTATGAPTTDLDGNLRPNPPSMGAYDTNASADPLLLPVLLVHGTNSNAVDAWSSGMSQRLTAEGFTVEAVNFPTEPETLSNETYIELQAKAIGRRVQELEDRTGQRHICIVCHSMGGLAARYYLEHLDLWPVHLDQTRQAGVDKLILLGTPNWGLDSSILDPVATVSTAHLKVLPLAADGYDTSAVDTYDNWSPAIKEMFAEWEPAPSSAGSGSYAYPNGYKLWSWPTNILDGSYETPMQAASYLYAQALQARFVVHPFGSDYLDITGVLNYLPSTPYSQSTNITHLKYYTQTAQLLGVMYPDGASVPGVDGRLVSPFLKTLNTTLDNSGAQIFMIAGDSPVAAQEGHITVNGPFNSAMLNDGIVPMDSALGQDPITGTYLYPQATRAIFGVGHTSLTGDPGVIDQVVKWLKPSPTTAQVHVLWTNTDGTVSIWNYDTALGTFIYNNYGPYAGWTAKSIADGPDGLSRVLWNNANGQASLWSLDNTIGVFTNHEFGPYPGWTAKTVSVGKDNTTHVLWTNTNGAASVWNYSTASGGFSQISYGPYPGWTAQAMADGPDGKARVLWTTTAGQISVWSLDNTTGAFINHEFGPYSGWTARSLSVGADNTTHVLWTNTSGQLSLWNYDATGGTFTYNNYGPYAGWTANSVADGSDGKTRVLWANTSGQDSLWSLDNTTAVFTNHEFGPFSGWTETSMSAP